MMRERLPAPAGTRIDRSRPVTFEFEGRAYTGYAGDTIASALAAHGEWCLSRSFKLHRPRGSFGFAGDEAGSLVQLETEPNVHADLRAIHPGMWVRGQNTVGSLATDWAALLERFERFLPVGFYYKAFYKPRGVWNWWEKIIRRTAGLGRVDRAWTPDYFDKAYGYCDVAVIGGGPAGLAAAAACGAQGLDVMLVEREPELGGWLTYGRLKDTGSTLDDLCRQVEALSSVRVLTSATCTGWFADNWLAITQGNRLHKIRAKSRRYMHRRDEPAGRVSQQRSAGDRGCFRSAAPDPALRRAAGSARRGADGERRGLWRGSRSRRARDGRGRRGRLPPGTGAGPDGV